MDLTKAQPNVLFAGASSPQAQTPAPIMSPMVQAPSRPTPITTLSAPSLPSTDPVAPAYDTQTGIVTPYGQSLGMPTRYTPNPYQVPTGNSYDSSMLHYDANQHTLGQTQDKKYQEMTNGTNTNYTPSDSLMKQLFESKQYTPQEMQTLQNFADMNTKITNTTLAERRQIKQLQEDGNLTTEGAKAFASESQRRADAHLADLAASQAGNTNDLNVMALIRGNQTSALQTLFDMTKGSQTLSPGQGLYSATGQQVAGAAGIAPQITSLAQQLYTQSLTSGNTMINPQTGQPDFGAYLQQASQLTGLPLPQGTAGPSSSSQNGIATQGQTTPGGTYGSQGYGNVNLIPQGFQKYVVQTPLSDSQTVPLAFVQEDKVPTALRDTMKSYAANAGIPYLDSQGTSAFYAAQQILNVVDAAKALSIRNLAKGPGGRVSNAVKAWANKYVQFNPDLSNFAQLNDAASKATTALAGGQGSGFRMNMGIIEAATANLPTANDSQETALTKADALATQIINGLKPVFPGVTTSNYGQLLNSTGANDSSSSGGGTYKSNSGNTYQLPY